MGTPDLSGLTWRKSSYSQPTQSDCVEIARTTHHLLVRDSKRPHGHVLTFAPAAWGRLLDWIKQAGDE
jgi:hypothetical protein